MQGFLSSGTLGFYCTKNILFKNNCVTTPPIAPMESIVVFKNAPFMFELN